MNLICSKSQPFSYSVVGTHTSRENHPLFVDHIMGMFGMGDQEHIVPMFEDELER